MVEEKPNLGGSTIYQDSENFKINNQILKDIISGYTRESGVRSLEKQIAKLIRNRADFYKFFTEHDLRRNTNFLFTFPEMHSFWQQCEEADALL